LRILLVDDEDEVRAVCADMLTRDGHEVIEAASGTNALARLGTAGPIDLVLADLGMPGMTGWDVARAVKTSQPSVLAGLVTGWGEDPASVPEQRAWVDFALSKPLDREALYGEVRNARSRHGRGAV